MKNLEQDHRALTILKKFGLGELTDIFDSIYTHTLVHFGLDQEPPEVVLLFAQKEIKEALRSDLLEEDGAFRALFPSDFKLSG